MTWTIADVWEAIAVAQPERAALVQGERVTTWARFDAHADALAAHLIQSGLGHQAKVAAYLFNGPEYLETYFAAFKGGYAPVNTNYRYGPEEIVYLFDNADAEAVVFHAGFTDLAGTDLRPPAEGEGVDRRRRAGPPRSRVGRRLRRHRRLDAVSAARQGALGSLRR